MSSVATHSWTARLLTAAALAAAGVLMFAAARERWWPACRLGAFDSAGCLELQSHERDLFAPTAPWEPVGDATVYAGVALLVLAVAALGLPRVLCPSPPSWRWRAGRALLGVVPGATLALLGTSTLRSGMSGEPAADSGLLTAAFLIWALVWPAALTVFAASVALATSVAVRPRGGVALAFLVGLSTPVPILVYLGPLLLAYASYDTTPWSEAAGTVALLAASALSLRARPAADARAPGVAAGAAPSSADRG